MNRYTLKWLGGLSLFICSCSPKLIQLSYNDSNSEISSSNLVMIRTIIQNDTSYVKNVDQIPQMVDDLNRANYNGIWKNIFWDKFQLVYKDSVVTYRTNGFVFSHEKSLHYYDLPESIQDTFFVSYD